MHAYVWLYLFGGALKRTREGCPCNQLPLNNPLLGNQPVMKSITAPLDSPSDGNAIRAQ